jgi:hypothetical protein
MRRIMSRPPQDLLHLNLNSSVGCSFKLRISLRDVASGSSGSSGLSGLSGLTVLAGTDVAETIGISFAPTPCDVYLEYLQYF